MSSIDENSTLKKTSKIKENSQTSKAPNKMIKKSCLSYLAVDVVNSNKVLTA